ncbi:hypothetical protein PVK06_009739 [Gossypium arboreum]|uniref:Tryptophan synthase beta chain-like PALP domain-containing protein n=1 Tax=Gossypium arboreum TaxID=29729 RepID=A0ABR0QNF7_GOSAR|nr:hypothetical protein PVK06_009739 [Gossypium arboreum]
MPVTTPEIKWQSVERLGATVVLVGDSYDEAQSYAKKRAKEESRTFIPPFDHPDVIMGQGTIGMEIVRQMQGPLHAIFVPVGGGGLIAGIAAYVKRVSPEIYHTIELKDQVIQEDYEYASYNPVAFDIANHFCEMAADYTQIHPMLWIIVNTQLIKRVRWHPLSQPCHQLGHSLHLMVMVFNGVYEKAPLKVIVSVAFLRKAPLKIMVFSGVCGKSAAKGHGL